MLRNRGHSNGCVVFSNYPAFLAAFQRGEVDRLVVVERLDRAPRASAKVASAN
jgi:DNA invertase Pin-like site-specific DNA recombinase